VNKKPLIGVSICAVVLLVLASLGNVVGYQTIQSSQPNLRKEGINQKELLVQTIVDIVNNKEIQRIILKSQMSRGRFPASDVPVLTKNQLRWMVFIGLLLSRLISNSKMQSIVGKHEFKNQEMRMELSTIIEKNLTLKREITQLQNSECDCENENTTEWDFPISCKYLRIIGFLDWYCLFSTGSRFYIYLGIIILIPTVFLYQILNCAEVPYHYNIGRK
jgi:hypothetical protein